MVADAVKNGEVINALRDDATFQIDSSVLDKAEAAVDGETKNQAQERMRLTTATVGKPSWPDGKAPEGFEGLVEPPGKHVKCVVSVGMLTEGWDAQNVTQILGLRAFSSQLLCEQVVGRGLRRMSYDIDPDTRMLAPEYCDVFGIPFEVIPVQGTRLTETPLPPPTTLVLALDERQHLAIEFPRVVGFICDVKQRIRCDVSKVPTLSVKPQVEPTEVEVRAQMGWVQGKVGRHTTTGDPEVLQRDQYYAEHRVQRTCFEIAREITEVLAGGRVSGGEQPEAPRKVENARMLFPQVLDVVHGYVAKRVKLSAGAQPEEIALRRYRGTIIERLLLAIEPETDEGEPAVLPHIDRVMPVGSTAGVQFRTAKPTKGTDKSHISHVVLDSTYEGSAAYYLETCPHVVSYAKNDRLGFEIFYDWEASRTSTSPTSWSRCAQSQASS